MPEKICIIGAGSSGITAAKVLQDHDIPFDCFEKGSHIGGNWKYMNDNGLSSAYASLHINTSKKHMAYSDFPMPNDYPDYPHHAQIAKYFEDYVDHFSLREKITFNTEVKEVSPSNGKWEITLDGAQKEEYRAVLVANGHHWDPRRPDFSGRFTGREIHSHDYRTPSGLENLNVLVVGIGNSAVDIACEVSRVAKETFLSTRHSAHIVPKYILGRPVDDYASPFMSRLPQPIQRPGFRLLLWLARGAQKNYGVPKPKHKIGQAHPTISSELLHAVSHAHVKMKLNIESLNDDAVEFVDGSREKIDVIIYATGYKISFPFLRSGLFLAKYNRLRLFCRVVHPDHANLFFIGFVQPLGAIMPLAELQSKWAALLLKGECALPAKDAMHRHVEKEQRKLDKRYLTSPRHTIQEDFYPYVRLLRKQMRMKRNHN